MHMHSDYTNIKMHLHVRVCVGSYVAGWYVCSCVGMYYNT